MTSRAAWPVENSAAGATTAASKTRMMLFMQYDSISIDSLRLLRIIARFGDVSGGRFVSTSLFIRCGPGVVRRAHGNGSVVFEPVARAAHAGARRRVDCRQDGEPRDAFDWAVAGSDARPGLALALAS